MPWPALVRRSRFASKPSLARAEPLNSETALASQTALASRAARISQGEASQLNGLSRVEPSSQDDRSFARGLEFAPHARTGERDRLDAQQ